MPLDRRRFLQLAGATALASCASAPEPEATTERPPNVILIMADDLGYETLGCYGGSSYETPRLDALAAEGVRFTHAYSQPLCTPTRLQLMTGQYNFRNWIAFGILDPEANTIGHMMSSAGYKTCISGKWQLQSYNPPDFEPEWRGKGMHPKDAGFDEYFLWHSLHTEDKGSRYAEPVLLDNGELKNFAGEYGPDKYTDYINGFIDRHHQDPFFVYYPMALTHGPFNPTPHSDTWADGDRLASDLPTYFGDMVEYMDFTIGRIIDKLDEHDLRENTLVIFYSDNGSPRGTESMCNGEVVKGGKGETTDAGTRVPLIVNWPGTAKPGHVVEDLMDSTDLIPTIAEATGVPKLEGADDGVSFLPQLRDATGTPREWVLVHHDPRPGWGKERWTSLEYFVRDQRWKLYEDGRLYDIANDVLEQAPITEGDAAQAARQKLQAVLDRYPGKPSV